MHQQSPPDVTAHRRPFTEIGYHSKIKAVKFFGGLTAIAVKKIVLAAKLGGFGVAGLGSKLTEAKRWTVECQ